MLLFKGHPMFDKEAVQKIRDKYPDLEMDISSKGIYRVKLQFTPEQWVDLADPEGEFLPACCGNISAVRDFLVSALRQGGWIDVDDLFDVVRTLREHHEMDHDDEIEPQIYLCNLWDRIEKDVRELRNRKPVDPNKALDAFYVLYQTSAALSWNFFPQEESTKEMLNYNSCKLRQYIRLLPAISAIYHELQKEHDPIEGYGLVHQSNGIAFTRTGGFCIYHDIKEAHVAGKYFLPFEDGKYTAENSEYYIQKVRVSLEKGVEYIGDLIQIDPEVKYEKSNQ